MYINMPPLPRKNKRKESKIDTPVLAWFNRNYDGDVAVEVKIKGGKLKPHQEAALRQVKNGTFYYKIPDDGKRKPLDGFSLKHATPFVVECDGNKCHATEFEGDDEFYFSLSTPY